MPPIELIQNSPLTFEYWHFSHSAFLDTFSSQSLNPFLLHWLSLSLGALRIFRDSFPSFPHFPLNPSEKFNYNGEIPYMTKYISQENSILYSNWRTLKNMNKRNFALEGRKSIWRTLYSTFTFVVYLLIKLCDKKNPNIFPQLLNRAAPFF